jgi:hypothetical protein
MKDKAITMTTLMIDSLTVPYEPPSTTSETIEDLFAEFYKVPIYCHPKLYIKKPRIVKQLIKKRAKRYIIPKKTLVETHRKTRNNTKQEKSYEDGGAG